MMKKIGIIVMVVCNSLFFGLAAVVGTETLAYQVMGSRRPDFPMEDFYNALLVCIVLVGMMNLLNRWYDQAAGYAGKRRILGRWAKNEILAGLFVVFIVTVSFIEADKTVNVIDSKKMTWMEIAGFGAVGIAVYLYLKNYHKTKDVGARIHDLMYQNAANHARRYTLLVEEAVKTDQKEIVLKGLVHGEMRVGDEVYLLTPKEEIGQFRIRQLLVNNNKVRKAKNVRVSLTFFGTGEEMDIPEFSVVSSVHPYCSKITDGENVVENPYLSGLLQDYTLKNFNKNYVSLLFYSICHAKYLIAGTAQNTEAAGDIMDVPQNRTDVGFSSVSQAGKSEAMLPIFTDWGALKNWKDIVNGDKSITLVLDFPHAVDIWKNGFSGIVIDPFGPRPFALSTQMIEGIVSSIGYREDFVIHAEERNG